MIHSDCQYYHPAKKNRKVEGQPYCDLQETSCYAEQGVDCEELNPEIFAMLNMVDELIGSEVCWCSLLVCHAKILMELANEE